MLSFSDNIRESLKLDRNRRSFRMIFRGVPQRSWPTFFITFTKDMEESCLFSIFYLHADDAQKTNKCLESLQQDPESIIQKTKEKGLTFNTKKIQLPFTRDQCLVLISATLNSSLLPMRKKYVFWFRCLHDQAHKLRRGSHCGIVFTKI